MIRKLVVSVCQFFLLNYLKIIFMKVKLNNVSAKRWWICAIGYALAGGFINNLIIAPFTQQSLIEWTPMLTALGVLLGISGVRDYLTRNKGENIPENVSDKGWKRMWIPITGWALFGGFFVNCVLAPYIDLRPNDWPQLTSILTVMLGISGARDVGLLPELDNADKKNFEKEGPS